MNAIVVGVTSAVALFVAFAVFDLSLLLSAAVGGGAFVVLSLIGQRRAARPVERVVTPTVAARPLLNVDLSGMDITAEQFSHALAEGSKKMAALAAFLPRIADQTVRAKVQAIVDLVARILTDIREDPKDLRPARQFLDFYLDSTIKVVDKYVTLKNKSLQNPDVVQALKRTEDSLDTIRAAYQKQLEQLQVNDVLSLDTELRVLEQTIRMEGLGEEPR